MIKLFRNIRQKMLLTGKLKPYLVYALGEIGLVMVGILLALQVNNWNEARKVKSENIDFLKSLKKELEVDLIGMTEKKESYTVRNDKIKETLILFKNVDQLTVTQKQIVSEALVHFQVLTPMYKNTTRNDYNIAKGTLNNISKELNDEYLTYLENIQSRNAIISKLGEDLHVISINVLNKFDFKYDLTASFNFNEIRHDREINNALNKSIWFRNIYLDDLNSFSLKAISLINRINDILGNQKE